MTVGLPLRACEIAVVERGADRHWKVRPAPSSPPAIARNVAHLTVRRKERGRQTAAPRRRRRERHGEGSGFVCTFRTSAAAI
eukprot:326278-Chlamydomonas_euryale.AAC.1